MSIDLLLSYSGYSSVIDVMSVVAIATSYGGWKFRGKIPKTIFDL